VSSMWWSDEAEERKVRRVLGVSEVPRLSRHATGLMPPSTGIQQTALRAAGDTEAVMPIFLSRGSDEHGENSAPIPSQRFSRRSILHLARLV